MKLEFPYYDEKTNDVDWSKIDELDWIQDMKGVEQDSIWHEEGDVYIHTKMVVEALLRLPEFIYLTSLEKHILIAAALLHDVEKRSTTITTKNGRIVSRDHSRKGENTARAFLYREVPSPFYVREAICGLVRHHNTPLHWAEDEDSNRYVIEASIKVNTKLVYILSKANILGRVTYNINYQIDGIDMFKELCIDNKCWGVPYPFKSNLGRAYYLNHKNAYSDYVPYDESKFEVTLMVGLPGAGKDYYVMQELCDKDVISLDDIRDEMDVKHGNKRGHSRVIQEAKERAKEFMEKDTDFVWNATNISKQIRRKLINFFNSYGGKVRIIYVEAPYEVLLAQNSQREDKVSDKAIEKMINKLEIPDNTEAPIVTYIFQNEKQYG